ncbi:hypothetical protein D7B24_009195 [Verticillium nonalfalfae]|uniref:Extracellular serine-rich protein n=1 Tax=Verticillium nonalfalfae TaxID=1051616 RepID=A0A3M9YII8_9PEZI|nr:uncharacterized protein D7B24_009195 [Verticillium nonalfalfae]RNJ60164.1 hypothetical protein D7B24_009195 [Verticillium nonalfalfae]
MRCQIGLVSVLGMLASAHPAPALDARQASGSAVASPAPSDTNNNPQESAVPVITTATGTVATAAPVQATDAPASDGSDSDAAGVAGTVLILARDEYSASLGSAGLVGYGINYEHYIVPKEGRDLPKLNSTLKHGNYGGIIVTDALAYEYDDGWHSAFSSEQWAAIHSYQADFRVRMVRINEYPGPQFGVTTVGGGCCGAGVEQLISFTDVSAFPTANIKKNAGVTSQGLWHYPASITDTATTKQVAKFGTGGTYTSETVAAVINKIDGREQFVWFTSWAPDWSSTSNYLQHAHIHWMTRGAFLGKRKTHLSAQIDDVQLGTDLYYPAGGHYKSTTADLNGHVSWQKNLNTRLPQGSSFWLEFAHNGNGDIEAATTRSGSENYCDPDTAVYQDDFPATALEFQKPLGTGQDYWPDMFTTYNWTKACADRDSFAVWFQKAANRDAFGHLSHTFSHMSLNNATYADVKREIQFNQAWMKQMGIDQATRFSAHGLVPPAITGMHNGDAIKAWIDNGITNVVGDNTRNPLRNLGNKYHPLTSTVADNGYAGLNIIPRFATTIYYNCDTAECTLREWKETSAGTGDFKTLLDNARATNTRYLMSLQSDPYMFHQANLRFNDQPTITVGTKTAKMSLVMAWVETIAQEMTRLTNWPITTLKHDDIGKYFIDRKTLDACKPKVSYGYAADGNSIKSITVTANGNSCAVPVPVTIPSGSVTAAGGSATADVVGSEPPIQWVTLSGSPVTLTLGTAVSIAA